MSINFFSSIPKIYNKITIVEGWSKKDLNIILFENLTRNLNMNKSS